MPIDFSYYARIDRNSANNLALNLTRDPAFQSTFVNETASGDRGDYYLDVPTGGGVKANMRQSTNDTRPEKPLSEIAVRLLAAHDRELSEYWHLKARERRQPPAFKSVEVRLDHASPCGVPFFREFLAKFLGTRSRPQSS